MERFVPRYQLTDEERAAIRAEVTKTPDEAAAEARGRSNELAQTEPARNRPCTRNRPRS